jgi:hypothetical protein
LAGDIHDGDVVTLDKPATATGLTLATASD